MKIIGVIPARWSSARFPGKILHPLCGKPLLHWVVERARCARSLSELLVATDDERIEQAARRMEVEAVRTSPLHPSGTDRTAEAVRGRGADVVLNIQGDEPLLDPDWVDRVAEAAAADGWEMATAAAPLSDAAALQDSSVVKVVFARDGRALYFSRAPIPFERDAAPNEIAQAGLHWRHIGLYAYRADFLERFVAEPPCALENAERLEQLRALDLGARIRVVCVDGVSLGVDTPDDVPRAEAALRRAGRAAP